MSTEELDNLINATCWICRPINQENKVEAIRFLTEEGVSVSAAQVIIKAACRLNRLKRERIEPSLAYVPIQ